MLFEVTLFARNTRNTASKQSFSFSMKARGWEDILRKVDDAQFDPIFFGWRVFKHRVTELSGTHSSATYSKANGFRGDFHCDPKHPELERAL